MVLEQDYPIHLGLAYLFFVGYLIRTIFVGLRLPGAVGVMVGGFAFSHFMQSDILSGREHLQALSFFLVLLTAGTEISLGDLKPYIICSALIPASLECAGIATYAYYVLEWSPVESGVLGVALFGLGDGLVIPKMAEFGHQFPGHHLPRLLFIWAPLEASFALTMFGVISGLSDPAGEEEAKLHHVAIANIVRLLATITVGALTGASVGWLISNRSWLPVPLTGSTVEAYLILLAAALAGFGLSTAEYGEPLVPIVITAGSLFQPELMVIVIGSLFARVVEPEVLHSVELTMGGVWVFGQLILFSMLGSKTEVSLFSQIVSVLPIMVVGFCLRFLGVLLVTVSTLYGRPCTCPACFKANKESVMTDALFCFLGTLPRATLQGALGQVPITERFFAHDGNRRGVQMFISMACRLYIVCMSVVGSILLDTFGPRLLQANRLREVKCEKHKSVQKEMEQGWTLKERRMTTAPEHGVERPSGGSAVVRVRTTRSSVDRNSLPARGVKKVGLEDTPLMMTRRRSDGTSQASEDMTHRRSIWSNLHQLDAKLVQATYAEDVDDESELWDGATISEEEEVDEKESGTPGRLASKDRRSLVQVQSSREYVDGDFLPNTKIRGEPIKDCAVSPL